MRDQVLLGHEDEGPRFSTIWPFTTLRAPPPCPDSTLTIPWCATVLTCTHALAMAWLAIIVCTVLCTKPVTALTICGLNVVSRELSLGSPLLFSCVTAWLITPFRLIWADDLVGDLVGQGVLDRRVVDQRLNGRYVAAGVGNLVAGPYADHGDQREHAAEDDEHDGDGSPPAEAPPVTRDSGLGVELGGFGAQPLQLGPFVLAEPGVLFGRSRLSPVRLNWHLRLVGHGSIVEPLGPAGITRRR